MRQPPVAFRAWRCCGGSSTASKRESGAINHRHRAAPATV